MGIVLNQYCRESTTVQWSDRIGEWSISGSHASLLEPEKGEGAYPVFWFPRADVETRKNITTGIVYVRHVGN